MISQQQLRYIQSLGEKWMQTTVVIHHKQPAAQDPSNPYGDGTVIHETTTTTVKGWLVPFLGKSLDVQQAQVMSVGDFKLRVPVGTDVEPEDYVVIAGQRYTVIDSGIEQTWPEWLTVALRRNLP